MHRTPGLLFAHASPVEPERWHYIHGAADLGEPFAAFAEHVCFVGQSILFAGLSELNFWDQEIATLIYFTVGLNIALFIRYKEETKEG